MKLMISVLMGLALTAACQEPPATPAPAAPDPPPPELAAEPAQPAPLLSVQAAEEARNQASIEDHVWIVETNWSRIGPIPPTLTVDKIELAGTQPGLVVSNRYVLIRAGDRTGRMLINSIAISNINRTFRHRVVRVYGDGAEEYVTP